MCSLKDDVSKEIENLGFTELTKVEIQEFEEQMALDKEFRRFILEDQKEINGINCDVEGLKASEIETEESYRVFREESNVAY
mgnify:CR=1 FL=1